MSHADKVTMGTYNFVSLIVKIILELALPLSAPAADKTQYFVHLSFDSISQLINGILNDLQKLFNDTGIVAFLKTPFATSATIFPYNLVLYLKDLKWSVFSMSLLKLVASSFE